MLKHDRYMPRPDEKPQTAQAWLLIKYDELCKSGDAIDVNEDDRPLEQTAYSALDHKPEPNDVYELLREFILERPAYWGFPYATAHPPHQEKERKHPIHVWYSDDMDQIVEARTHKPVLAVRIHGAYLFTVDGDMFESSIQATYYGCYELGTHMLAMHDIHSHQTTFWIPKETDSEPVDNTPEDTGKDNWKLERLA